MDETAYIDDTVSIHSWSSYQEKHNTAPLHKNVSARFNPLLV